MSGTVARRKRTGNGGTSVKHPTYDQSGARRAAEASWEDREREKSGRDITKRFRYIIAFCVAILIVIALAAITASRGTQERGAQPVTAADTYAISSSERKSMEQTARDFATALVSSTYLSDEKTAKQMRALALTYMASGTNAYSSVEGLPIGKGDIGKDDMYVNVRGLKMTSGSQSYSGTYVYTLTAQAGNRGKKSYEDRGYKMTLYFQKADGDDGTQWVISDVNISEA